MNAKKNRIVIPGGAGLVGQNLVTQLREAGYSEITVIDKHKVNLEILQQIHPFVITVLADLSVKGEWKECFQDADVVVMLQAQIGGNDLSEFERNNIDSTLNVLSVMNEVGVTHLIHVSSSVVESISNDWYTNSKKQQEEMVKESGLSVVVLRPTLMFGWFDRKHLGWLSRFMMKVPVFPIPGKGRYMRQPLYAGDLCRIIISCIKNNKMTGVYNISGREEIDYVDMIKSIKNTVNARTFVLSIPIRFFGFLLWLWSVFDKTPPFTKQQLEALTAHDQFEVIDWPKIFGVEATPFQEALAITFNHPVYSKIVLEF